MRAPRAPVLVMGLVLFICTTVHSYPSERNSEEDEKTWFRRIMDIMRKVENSVGDGSAQSASKDSQHHLKTENGEPILEIFPRDLRKKQRIIQNITGPLYFGPKCKKQVYRLYHNTRDCTDSAYYRRCARLLRQLAKSPRCQEG